MCVEILKYYKKQGNVFNDWWDVVFGESKETLRQKVTKARERHGD